MRFASHRDVARAIERGVRVAGVPVAYSAGFTPHPKISYSGGAPTGSASEAEFLEISLTRRCEPRDVGQRLDAALPDGIDVVDVIEADGRSAGLLEASEWEVIWPGVAPDAAALAAAAFLDAPSVEVERLTSKGLRRLDARAAVVSLEVGAGGARRAGADPSAGCAILRMVVQQMTPAVRPDDVLTALCQLSALAPAGPAMTTRLWQGPLGATATAAMPRIVAAGASPADGPSTASPANAPGAPGAAAAAELAPGEHGDGHSGRRGGSEPGSARRGQRGHGHGMTTAVFFTDQMGDPADQAESSSDHAGDPAGEAEPPEDQTGDQAGQAGRPPRMPASRAEHVDDNDKAVRLRAGRATMAPAERVRADEQLPRGARVQLAGPGAREPYGRDSPDARNRATEPTVRYQ